jgi:methyltransferase (TIGR00027 family)
MNEDRPSSTAHGAAFLRAAHQILDTPKIFDDPVALKILGAEEAKAIRSNPGLFQTADLRSLRAYVAMRSRYTEDELAKAIARGVRQYVILGAGLDTFAYRNPYVGTVLRVFEVDHPATQAWKQNRLREEGIDVPASLTFAPVDFERQSLADGLSIAGFRTGAPTFFSWLGVTVYLSKQAVMETLAFVVSATAEGSGIVFTFSSDTPSGPRKGQSGIATLADRVAAIGEPYLTYFDPPGLGNELRLMGFKHAEYFAPDKANLLYFSGRSDGLRIEGMNYHIMYAGL